MRNNRAWGNSDAGIMLRTIQDSVIENNVVAGNGRGFFIYDAEYNTIRNNLVIDNDVGAHVWAGSIHNQVDGNDFVDNREQVRYVAARDERWGAKAGNYWSNYVRLGPRRQRHRRRALRGQRRGGPAGLAAARWSSCCWTARPSRRCA